MRMLFEALKTDIRDGRREVRHLRDEVLRLVQVQDDKVRMLEQWRWKWAGALAVGAVVLEIVIKAAEKFIK